MRRRHIILLGVAILLAMSLLAVLAGPASASTCKKVCFQAATALAPATKDATGNPADPGQWIYSKMWTANGLNHTTGWLWVGQAYVPTDPSAGPIPYLTGYCEDYVNVIDKENPADPAGASLWAYTYETSTIYVGCNSLADVTKSTSIWKGYAVSYAGADQTAHYTGVSYGVAGAVKGWAAYWHADVNVWTGVNDIYGYYIMK
jgi:hypothetical protein